MKISSTSSEFKFQVQAGIVHRSQLRTIIIDTSIDTIDDLTLLSLY